MVPKYWSKETTMTGSQVAFSERKVSNGGHHIFSWHVFFKNKHSCTCDRHINSMSYNAYSPRIPNPGIVWQGVLFIKHQVPISCEIISLSTVLFCGVGSATSKAVCDTDVSARTKTEHWVLSLGRLYLEIDEYTAWNREKIWKGLCNTDQWVLYHNAADWILCISCIITSVLNHYTLQLGWPGD